MANHCQTCGQVVRTEEVAAAVYPPYGSSLVWCFLCWDFDETAVDQYRAAQSTTTFATYQPHAALSPSPVEPEVEEMRLEDRLTELREKATVDGFITEASDAWDDAAAFLFAASPALEELLRTARLCVADLADGSAILYDYNEEALRAALTACDSIP